MDRAIPWPLFAPRHPQGITRARLLALALLAGCGSTGPSGDLQTASEACAGRPVTQLAAAGHVVLDPAAAGGCLRLPAAGSAGAQYALVLASTNGSRSSTGIKGTYFLHASNPGAVVALEGASAPEAAAARSSLRSGAASRFHGTLRERERGLSADPLRYPRLAPSSGLTAAPPPLGDLRTFKTCNNLQCSSFTNVAATARWVGEHAVIYVDNTVPQNNPLTDADLDNLGTAFDTHHYPIDTTAFGRESDIDNNGVVLILMTDAVNALTPDCTDGRVVGYFFGGDLLTGSNSNRAEIFYTLVPAPATPDCGAVTRAQAVNALKATLIHEFQHMISFNQHVLVRGGISEDIWLNEALSHFAEELGGRLVPDAECIAAGFNSCRSQYTGGNIQDAYDYLRDTEAAYMTFPSSGQGTLAERGAAWLFLRWTLDQFAPNDVLATQLTQALVQTSNTGVANITAATGGNFQTMVPQWLLACFLDDGPLLPVEPTGRLRFTSWGLRAIWTDPRNSGIFPAGFPLVPLDVADGFQRADTLKAGSGKHFLITQGPDDPELDLQVLRNDNGAQLDPNLQARFGIVRIR